ncbi:MAG: GNAT family N-acetyltransferase [Chloroflexota bacterium]|nr:GNAT family N-acetyltransferase [Chloroflexota bacterium]
MTICIKYAETTDEIDGIFRTRHKVYVEEEGYMAAQPNGRVYDRFDAYPTTVNIIAVDDGRVIGGARFCAPSTAGAPPDDFFDFAAYLPKHAIGASGSMLCIERTYRKIPELAFSIMGMGFRWVHEQGLSFIIGAANPDAQKFLLRLGFHPVAQTRYDEHKQLLFIPVILSMDNLSTKILAFLERQRCDQCWVSAGYKPGASIPDYR